MSYLLFFLTILAIASAEGACINNDMKTVVSTMNGFGLELARDKLEKEENAVFSPFSIGKGLVMLYAAANGTTRSRIGSKFITSFENRSEDLYAAIKNLENEFKKLDLNQAARRSYVLLPASQAYEEFLKRSKENFFTQILSGYEMKDLVRILNTKINSSFDQSSKADFFKVKLHPEDNVKAALLYNYDSFKGNWSTPFLVDETDTMGVFYWNETSKGCENYVPMMYGSSTELWFDNTNKKYKVLGIPLEGQQLGLFMFLNKTSSTLDDVLYELSDNKLADVIKNIKRDGTESKVSVPAFELYGNELDLKSFLITKLKMRKLFNKPELTGIVPNIKVPISAVIHKAYFKMNEKGVDAGEVSKRRWHNFGDDDDNFGDDDDNIIFEANRPFLFVVGHRQTGAVLLQGIYQKHGECKQTSVGLRLIN